MAEKSYRLSLEAARAAYMVDKIQNDWKRLHVNIIKRQPSREFDLLIKSSVEDLLSELSKIDILLDENAALASVGYIEGTVSKLRNDLAQLSVAVEHYSRQQTPKSGSGKILYDFKRLTKATINSFDAFLEETKVPRLPQHEEQEPGVKFALTQDGVDFIPASLGHHGGDDIKRLNSLLPILRDQAENAFETFSRGNNQYPRVTKALYEYRQLLIPEAEAIDFDRVAAYGIILANAEAAALREIEDRLTPQFEDDHKSELRSLLDLHGPFILSTQAGRNLLDYAAAYNLTRAQEEKLKRAAVTIAQAVSSQELTTPSAGELLVTTTTQIGQGPFEARSSVIGFGTVRNFAVVALGGAAIVMYGGVALQTVGAILVYEGIKKSKLGQGISGVFQDGLDSPNQKKNLRKLYKFVLEFESELRTLAGQRRELNWIEKTIDWIKAKKLEG